MTSNSLRPVIKEMIDHFGSQELLAEAADVSQPAVSQWFNNKSKPDASALLKIQKASKRKFIAKKIRPELF